MSDLRKGSRILVVDDDAILREAIARQLRRAGHFVVTAEAATIALAHAELGRTPFDVVVTDVHMPGMSGLDLATALMERRPTQRVVIMTGDPDGALQRAALARGPVSFLLKPFEFLELDKAVDTALAMPRLMRAPPPAAQRAYRQAAIGMVPAEWLLWVDDRTNAGAGHADRVARMARVVGLLLPQPLSAFELAELEVAAWSHEIGLLRGPTAHPVEMAQRSAEILKQCGSNDLVAELVQHMHERWDGSGGPAGLVRDGIPLGCQILSAVDSIDHYCAAWVRTDMPPDLAAHRAIELAVAQEGTCFSPLITQILNANRDALRSVCAVPRRPAEQNFDDMPTREMPIRSTLAATG